MEVGKPWVGNEYLTSDSYSLQYGPGDDFDGEGIINSADIDDDKGGVLDAIESPGCFCTFGEISRPSNVTTGMTLEAANSGLIPAQFVN